MNQIATIARYDFTNVRRSKMLWGVILLYVGFGGLLFYSGGTGGEQTVVDTLFFQMFSTALFLPLVAIVAGYLSIAGERESNTIKFLLSRPVPRSSIVLGKFISRGMTVLVALLAGFLVGIAIAAALYPSLALVEFLQFVSLTVLFVGAYVSTAIGLSAMTDTRSKAMATTIGFYFVTDILWVFGSFSVIGALGFFFEGVLGLSPHDHFYEFVYRLSPTGAYLNTEYFIFDASNYDRLPALGSDLPFYLEPWFSVLIMLAWIVVPLIAGYLSFEQAEV